MPSGGVRRRAADQLLPLVYDELRPGWPPPGWGQEAPGQTLQPIALVLRGVPAGAGARSGPSLGRNGPLYAAAAKAMRRILINRGARDRKRLKRGGGRNRQPSRPRRTHRRGRVARRPHRPRRGPGPTRGADRRPGGPNWSASATPDCRSTRPPRPWAWSAVPPSTTGRRRAWLFRQLATPGSRL